VPFTIERHRTGRARRRQHDGIVWPSPDAPEITMFFRSSRDVAAAAWIWVGLLLATPLCVHAGAGALTTVVTPLSPAVTYSAPAVAGLPALDTYVGYTVSIANVGGNTINNVRFTGTALAADFDEQVAFGSAEGRSCSASGGSIECTIGQVRAGEAVPVFAVFFKVPVRDSATPLPDGSDHVLFSGTTFYAEGTGGPNSVPQNSTGEWSAANVTLGTFNPTVVKSAVPRAGAKLFTGNGGVSSGTDPFATLVTIPAGASFTTAEISEAPDIVGCGNNFSACFRSDVTIPGSFSPYLTIVLRQDASTILKGTKIESVLIQYTGSAGTQTIGLCASPTTPRSDGIPCMASRVHYKSNRTPGWTQALDGDFEWTLINLGNGSYKVF